MQKLQKKHLQYEAIFATAPKNERSVWCGLKSFHSILMRVNLIHVQVLVDIVDVDVAVGGGARDQRVARTRQEFDAEDVAAMLGLDHIQTHVPKRIPEHDFQIVRSTRKYAIKKMFSKLNFSL
jgi:hypothetical protein